jgi:bis(5'-nucleosyl)-tetraphosphatase (symmetrical)
MSTYAIGSINGYYSPLLKLLEKIAFNPEQDKLWFTGNLVNGGADGLAVLRFIKDLGKNAVTVLGSQELHLLTVAEGLAQLEVGDTFAEILNAPDKDELIKWLRKRSLIHHDSKLNFTLVHAGIPAAWTFSQALTFAYEVESVLSGSNYHSFLENQGKDQTRWNAKLRGWRRLRYITNAYTVMKYCDDQGKLDFNACGSVDQQTEGLLPWYKVPGRITANLNIMFADDGNFADAAYPGVYPLPENDSLCAWKLSEIPEMFSVEIA